MRDSLQSEPDSFSRAKVCSVQEGEASPQMNEHPEPDPAPFKVHLITRAGRAMRARSEPVRAFSTKDEAVRFAGRQLGGNYAVYHKDRKIWPISHDAPR